MYSTHVQIENAKDIAAMLACVALAILLFIVL